MNKQYDKSQTPINGVQQRQLNILHLNFNLFLYLTQSAITIAYNFDEHDDTHTPYN